MEGDLKSSDPPAEPDAEQAPSWISAPSPTVGIERRIGLAQIMEAVGVGADDGSRMGRFVVQGKLGRGAMGSVFEAHDPDLDRLVAIKVLHPDRDSQSDPGSTIRQEARALARLTHPNVVSIYDVGVEQGQVFVAMEHMAGGALSDLLRADPPRDWTGVATHFIAAGEGLAAAHAAGIVHRDFKAENVLLDGNGVAKVADFGLAQLRNRAGASDSTVANYLVGTPAYMAPEVQSGGPVGPATDQYAYCASMAAALRAHGGAVPATVWSLLSRGMRDDPQERWPTVAELVGALKRRVDGVGDRHRRALIDRVRNIWIDGVLKSSLDGRPLVPLRMSRVPELVDSPWEHVPTRSAQPTESNVRSSDLPAIFQESNGALLLVGGPGAGKSTLMVEFARSLIELAEDDVSAPVPAVLNLASFRGAQLRSWVAQELVAKYRLPRKRVAHWLDSDEIVLLLDGLDELPSSHREACIRAINDFRCEHPVPLVVACREPEYRASDTRLVLGAAVRIEPLQADDAAHWGVDGANAIITDERLRTPLWLTLAAGRTAHGALSWDEVYASYVADALDRAPAVPPAERELWWTRLRWLAANMARRGHSELWLDAIQYTWIPGVARRGLAVVLAMLVLAAIFLIPSMVVLTAVGLSTRAGVILGTGGLAILLAFNGGLKVRTGERMRWSWRKGLRRTPLMVGLCLGIGVPYALLASRPLLSTLFAAVTGGVVVGMQLGLEYADESRGIRPYDGLRTALRQCMLTGLGGAAVTGLAYALVISPSTAYLFPEWVATVPPGVSIHAMHSLPLGTVFGVTLSALYGGVSVALHATYRLVLAATTPLPLRLIDWLDDATRRGLTRRVGGGYMFMHATLLDSLARGLDAPRLEGPQGGQE